MHNKYIYGHNRTGCTWKNRSRFNKRKVAPGKMGNTLKPGSHLEKWVPLGRKGITLVKKDHTCKNRSHVIKVAPYSFSTLRELISKIAR